MTHKDVKKLATQIVYFLFFYINGRKSDGEGKKEKKMRLSTSILFPLPLSPPSPPQAVAKQYLMPSRTCHLTDTLQESA